MTEEEMPEGMNVEEEAQVKKPPEKDKLDVDLSTPLGADDVIPRVQTYGERTKDKKADDKKDKDKDRKDRPRDKDRDRRDKDRDRTHRDRDGKDKDRKKD